MVTKGKGEDEEEEESEEEEPNKEVKPVKKKGRVIITKPHKQPIVVFTRRTRRGKKEVVFSKPPLTFEETLKKIEVGTGMQNFKALKF